MLDFTTAVSDLDRDRAWLAEDWGIFIPEARAYLPKEAKRNFRGALDEFMAFDAQPTLATTPNSGIPAMLTTFIDPDILRVLFSPLKIALILGANGERKKGDWTDMQAMFPVVEATGEPASYGDYSNNGRAGLNMAFPQRQSYHFQIISEYGEREIEMAAKARVNLAGEKMRSAVMRLNMYSNASYAFGIANLQNYGLLNDPALNAALQPGPKAFGSAAHGPWITAGVVTATPTEVYTDVQSLYIQLVAQSAGVIEVDSETRMVLALPPDVSMALLSANSFGVMTRNLLKEAFPNLRIETAKQYNGSVSGLSGNLGQLIVEEVQGQETAYCAFTEKLRTGPLVAALSSWSQKLTQGTWGCINRQPWAVAGMLGL